MEKVSLLILLAILASTLMMAALPTRMVRLTVINKSGYDVYMKLEGSAITEAYYYLTIPAGGRDQPTVKIFTWSGHMQDIPSITTSGRKFLIRNRATSPSWSMKTIG